MKCPRCLAVCMPTDPMCYSCRAPLAAAQSGNPYAPGPNGRPPLAARVSMACGVLGACAGQLALNALLPDRPEDKDWIYRAVAAGIGASVVGGIGFALVALFTRGRTQPGTPFDQPLVRR